MGAVIAILFVIFGGIALITFVDNTTKAQRRALPRPDEEKLALPPALSARPDPAESLALRLTEPERTRVWALLCQVVDAQQAGAGGDSRAAYLLAQTRDAYLPDTLRAYLALTDGARRTLAQQGQPAETLLAEQLSLLEDGVAQALRHDHASADRLLTQGRFLRERFGLSDSDLALPPSQS